MLKGNGDDSDAIDRIKQAGESNGAKVVRGKPLNLKADAKGYRDVKVSIRFPNSGVGEGIIVSNYIAKAKSKRGGHAVYAIYRTLEKYRGTNELVDDALDALNELTNAIDDRGPGALDTAAFERAKAKASSSVTRLLETDLASLLSSEDIITLKSSSSGINLANPPSVDSYATPLAPFMKNTPTSLSSGNTESSANGRADGNREVGGRGGNSEGI